MPRPVTLDTPLVERDLVAVADTFFLPVPLPVEMYLPAIAFHLSSCFFLKAAPANDDFLLVSVVRLLVPLPPTRVTFAMDNRKSTGF